MVPFDPKVESSEDGDDGKLINAEENEQRSQEAQLCCASVGCGEAMNKVEFRPILIRNLKELLPDNTQVQGSLYSNTRGGAEAVLLVRFNDGDQWVNWVLDGFNETSDRTLERALELWQTKGPALFEVVTRGKWKRQPGWACNPTGYVGDLQTPNHYFRYSEVDYGKHQYGSHYDGSSDVKGFLKEMKLHIMSLDPEPFGDLF
ncbi:hypothetical protein IFR05_012738 [Cadophora sp. M221]|nr:hypothetical protein IFR05_012738 [Cadophora sp. M221]